MQMIVIAFAQGTYSSVFSLHTLSHIDPRLLQTSGSLQSDSFCFIVWMLLPNILKKTLLLLHSQSAVGPAKRASYRVRSGLTAGKDVLLVLFALGLVHSALRGSTRTEDT